MLRKVILLALIVGALTAFYRNDSNADEPKTLVASKPTPAKLTMMLVPSANGKSFSAVAAPKGDRPKNATLIACDSMKFTKEGVTFQNVRVESAGQHATASHATLNAETASLEFADDVSIALKSKAAKESFLRDLKR